MEINFKINGAQALEAALKKLPDKLARKAGESAVRAAGNVLKKGIQEKAPVDDGRLKKSIIVKKMKVGPAGINYVVASKAPYAHLVEFGATAHKIVAGIKRGHSTKAKVLSDGETFFGKDIQHPGAKAKPFFRPAIDEKMPAALIRMQEVMARAINNQATKFIEE